MHSDGIVCILQLSGEPSMLDPVELKLSSSIAPERTKSFNEIGSELTPSTSLGGLACWDSTTSTEVRGSMYLLNSTAHLFMMEWPMLHTIALMVPSSNLPVLLKYLAVKGLNLKADSDYSQAIVSLSGVQI